MDDENNSVAFRKVIENLVLGSSAELRGVILRFCLGSCYGIGELKKISELTGISYVDVVWEYRSNWKKFFGDLLGSKFFQSKHVYADTLIDLEGNDVVKINEH